MNTPPKNSIQENSADFWEHLSPNQKSEIDKTSLEIENGELIDYEVFMENHRLIER